MTMDDNSNSEHNPLDEYRDPFVEEPSEEEEGEKKSPNRTFVMILGIVGSILILVLIALIAIVIINRNRSAARFVEQAAQINATNTAIAQLAQETASVESRQMTEKAMPPTWTPTLPAATSTPAPTRTATAEGLQESADRTATIAAFLTQVSANTAAPTITSAVQQQATSPVQQATTAVVRSATPRTTLRATSTALPTTGFADEAGLPGLFGLALALVVIIVLVRRLRLSASQ